MSNKLQIFNSDGTAFYDIVLENYTYSHTTMSLDASIAGSFVSDLDLRDKFKHTEYVLYKDVKYYLIADVTSTRDSAFSDKDKGLFRYTVKFNAPMIELQRMFMYDPQTGQRSYAFYGDVKRLTDDIEYNLVGNWRLVYQPNFIPSTEVPDEPISFDGATVADALNKLYSEKNVPFTVEGYTIYIGTPVTEVGHTFKYSKEGGLKTEPTTPKNNDICTQVYPIGSTQNIPYPYPKIYDSEGEYARVYKRRKADGSLTSVSVFKTHLMPSIYRETLQAHVDNGYDADNYPVVDYYTADDTYVNPFNPELPLPLEVTNEDIRPTIEGATYNGNPIDVLADVSYYENDNDVVNTETGEVEVPMFKITLPPMGFDVYAQAAVTGAMTIAMKSGDTIGASYKIQVSEEDFNKNFYKTFEDLEVAIESVNSQIDRVQSSIAQNSSNIDAVEDEYNATKAQYDLILSRYEEEVALSKKNNGLLKSEVLFKSGWAYKARQGVDSKPKYFYLSDYFSDYWIRLFVDNELFTELELGYTIPASKLFTTHFLYSLRSFNGINRDPSSFSIFQTLQSNVASLVFNNVSDDDFYVGSFSATSATTSALADAKTKFDAASAELERVDNDPLYSQLSNLQTQKLQLEAMKDVSDFPRGGAIFDPANRDYEMFPDSTNESITIDVLKDIDTFGVLVPQEYRRPSAGDKFVLLNIEMPLSYVTQAEGNLSEYGKEWMRDNNEYLREYPIKFDEALFHNNATIANQITTNALIPYEIGGVLRKMPIQKITIKYYDKAIPTYDLTLTDEIVVSQNAVASNTQKLQEQAYEVKQNETKNADRARHNSYLTQKTLDGLFDAEGGNRIDNVEASVGYFNGLFVGQNPNDFGLSDVSQTLDATSAQFSGSTLTHFWADAPFENKVWTIAPSDIIQLEDTKQYYLYIQANRVNDSAIWVISPEQKLYNEDSNVWFFNAGQIIYYGGFWSFVRTYGITTTIGATISTEMIKSHNYENTADAFTGMMIDFFNARIYMGQGAEIVTNQITFKSANGAEGVKVFTEEGLIDANSIDVDNLVARKIQTSESGTRVQIMDNTLDVFDDSDEIVTTLSGVRYNSIGEVLDVSNIPQSTPITLPSTIIDEGENPTGTPTYKQRTSQKIEVARIQVPDKADLVFFELPLLKIDWKTKYTYTEECSHWSFYSGASVRYILENAALNIDVSAGGGYEAVVVPGKVVERSGSAIMRQSSRGYTSTAAEIVVYVYVEFRDYGNVLNAGDSYYNTVDLSFADPNATDVTFSKELSRTHIFGNGGGFLANTTNYDIRLITDDGIVVETRQGDFYSELWQTESGVMADGTTWIVRKSNRGYQEIQGYTPATSTTGILNVNYPSAFPFKSGSVPYLFPTPTEAVAAVVAIYYKRSASTNTHFQVNRLYTSGTAVAGSKSGFEWRATGFWK